MSCTELNGILSNVLIRLGHKIKFHLSETWKCRKCSNSKFNVYLRFSKILGVSEI